jgi:hypothetical protein
MGVSFDFNAAAIIPTGVAAVATFWTYRINQRWTFEQGRWTKVEERLSALENAVGARELATKEDVNQASERLREVEQALTEIKVMLGRMDERWKLTHGG